MSLSNKLLNQLKICRNIIRNSQQLTFSFSTLPIECQEDDKLYKSLVLDVRAHNQDVLNSYQQFTVQAAKELDIEFVKSENPWRTISKKPLLKSKFVHKDHRAMYEWRTYYLMLYFKNLTGSTMDTFLEYIERNLPEGVMLIVEKHALAKIPPHLSFKNVEK